MAFCSFDDSAALFDSTPVENMFITEYMLRAPGDFVKVYLYALMLCYHPTPRMSLSSMAKDLDMQEEDVDRAFKYWARDGLVRQVGDNPVTYSLYNLKQLTLTRAENPGDKLYNQQTAQFIEEAERILKRTLLPEETNLINDWVQVFELPEEVVLMLLQIEMENSRGRVSHQDCGSARERMGAERRAHGTGTFEKIIVLGKEREQQLRRLLAQTGTAARAQRRRETDVQAVDRRMGLYAGSHSGGMPRNDEGNADDGISERHIDAPAPAGEGTRFRRWRVGMQREKEARDFARDVYAGLGRTGITPSQDDLAAISAWREQGASDELIMMAVSAAHRRAGGGNMDDVDAYLQNWRQRGMNTPDAVRAKKRSARVLDAQRSAEGDLRRGGHG